MSELEFRLVRCGSSWSKIHLRDDLVIRIEHSEGVSTIYSSVVELLELYQALSEPSGLQYTTARGTHIDVSITAGQQKEPDYGDESDGPDSARAISLGIGSSTVTADQSTFMSAFHPLLAEVFRAKDRNTDPENRGDGMKRLQELLNEKEIEIDVFDLREEVYDPSLLPVESRSNSPDAIRDDLLHEANRAREAGDFSRAGYIHSACCVLAAVEANFAVGIELIEGYVHLSQAVSDFVLSGEAELATQLVSTLSSIFDKLFDQAANEVELGLFHEYRGDLCLMVDPSRAAPEYLIASRLYEQHFTEDIAELWTGEDYYRMQREAIQQFLKHTDESLPEDYNERFDDRAEYKLSVAERLSE